MREKKRILVVDDDQNTREGLTKILMREGYKVVAAKTGSSALDEAKKQDFDLIITDLIMPEVSGIEVLKRVRKEKPGIGVIIVTAYGEVNSYLRAMTLGAFEYLNKPLMLTELRYVINKALNQS
ncbi:MAG: response regulator [bacterium]